MDENLFLHETDKAALSALKAIPGFSQLVKAFMKVWDEKMFKIINMSTNLKLDEKQLAKYYNMLIPICEKLHIDVPELYVTLDVVPNAYTYGDTKPFIVITSGLFETLPDELIPTVLAHECGHIVCHHTLYMTMGRTILNSAFQFLPGLGNLALYSFQVAFAYWMRCSEYSADRVAAICDGTADKVVELCMRFAGYNKDIADVADPQLFINQAEEYIDLIQGSSLNKTMEFFLLSNRSHPLNAVRAYEINAWCNEGHIEEVEEAINRGQNYEPVQNAVPISLLGLASDIRMRESVNYYIGRHYLDVQLEFQVLGFANICVAPVPVEGIFSSKKKNLVAKIEVNGLGSFERNQCFDKDAKVIIYYYTEN